MRRLILLLVLMVAASFAGGDRDLQFGPAHQAGAEALHRAGVVHLSQGRLDQAEAAFRQALFIRQAGLGLRHPSAAIELESLAGIAERRGDQTAAQSLRTEAGALLRYTVR